MAGMLFLRHGLGAAAAVAAWATAVAADPGTCDDVHFAVLARGGRPAPRSVLGRLGALGVRDEAPAAHPADTRLVLGFGGGTAVGVLPLAAFGNGHTFFVQRLQEARRPPCVQVFWAFLWLGHCPEVLWPLDLMCWRYISGPVFHQGALHARAEAAAGAICSAHRQQCARRLGDAAAPPA